MDIGVAALTAGLTVIVRILVAASSCCGNSQKDITSELKTYIFSFINPVFAFVGNLKIVISLDSGH